MAYIKAISTFTPSCGNILTNSQLREEFPDVDIDKIAKGVGVNQRYAAEEGQTASDMAYEAARRMFDEWNIKPDIIDFIIFATQKD